MDSLSPRQAAMVQLARSVGRLTVEDLARQFEVTPQTIRRDLNELCERRILARVHGGAIMASGVTNLSYSARRFVAAEAKRSIGEAAARLIPSACSLFINIGTTTEEVARALKRHEQLLVVTNNLNVATELYEQPEIEVVVAGGAVRRMDGGIVGSAAVSFIEQFKLDYAVIGVSAIDEEGALLDYDFREVQVAQAIIRNARHVILVADSTKLTRTAPVRIGRIDQVKSFVTNHLPSEPLRAVCRAAGVALVETGVEATGDAGAETLETLA
jgi:DeoR family glycerol-3-phosphate regulon repressor